MNVKEAIHELVAIPEALTEKENDALDFAICVLEMRIPKKPTRDNSWQPWKCSCGNAVMDDSNFCKKCGQALDWSK